MYLVIIIMPLLGSIISGFFGRKVGVKGSQIITCSLVILTTLLAILAFIETGINKISVSIYLFKWIDSESLNVYWGFNFDSLTISMLIPVLVVSSLVHVYSIGYMSEDPHNQRFFSYLSLFTFMMIILVTANNYLLMFVGWEGVGICSYLLVSFWFTRIAANQSSISAILTNRVGDCFLTIGMFGILWSLGNLDYATVFSLAPFINENTVTIIGICLLIGAMAKSSQIGLHVWLPMAMEGPTPVSALIHAATMVTAGVYLLIRSSPLIEYSSTVLLLCLWIGAITTLFSSLIGLFQQDIKKVIAYSTMSQLGLMVIAVGLSSYHVALFHLVNHAFYKALLFLGAGAVIHAVADNQDFRKYGGLKQYLPLSYSVMLIASLSLVAFPFMTGFFSKDFILESSYGYFSLSSITVYYIATVGAMFTTLYSIKTLYLTFITNPNGPLTNYRNLHEGNIYMSLPLIILALFSIFFGFIAKDTFIGLGSDLFTDNSIFIHPTNEIMLNTEFAVPTVYKLLPLIFTVSLTITSLIISGYMFKNLMSFKFSRFGYNMFSFFNLRFLIELIYNRYITENVLKLGGQTTRILDKGLVEYIGPYGLKTALTSLSLNLNYLNTPSVTNYALYIVSGGLFFFTVYFLTLVVNPIIIILLLINIIMINFVNKNNHTDNKSPIGYKHILESSLWPKNFSYNHWFIRIIYKSLKMCFVITIIAFYVKNYNIINNLEYVNFNNLIFPTLSCVFIQLFIMCIKGTIVHYTKSNIILKYLALFLISISVLIFGKSFDIYTSIFASMTTIPDIVKFFNGMPIIFIMSTLTIIMPFNINVIAFMSFIRTSTLITTLYNLKNYTKLTTTWLLSLVSRVYISTVPPIDPESSNSAPKSNNSSKVNTNLQDKTSSSKLPPVLTSSSESRPFNVETGKERIRRLIYANNMYKTAERNACEIEETYKDWDDKYYVAHEWHEYIDEKANEIRDIIEERKNIPWEHRDLHQDADIYYDLYQMLKKQIYYERICNGTHERLMEEARISDKADRHREDMKNLAKKVKGHTLDYLFRGLSVEERDKVLRGRKIEELLAAKEEENCPARYERKIPRKLEYRGRLELYELEMSRIRMFRVLSGDTRPVEEIYLQYFDPVVPFDSSEPDFNILHYFNHTYENINRADGNNSHAYSNEQYNYPDRLHAWHRTNRWVIDQDGYRDRGLLKSPLVQSPVIRSPYLSPIIAPFEYPIIRPFDSPILAPVRPDSPILRRINSPILGGINSPILERINSPCPSITLDDNTPQIPSNTTQIPSNTAKVLPNTNQIPSNTSEISSNSSSKSNVSNQSNVINDDNIDTSNNKGKRRMTWEEEGEFLKRQRRKKD